MSEVYVLDTTKDVEFVITHSEPNKMYVCGPTVYTASHIGHLKTYITFDIIHRIFCDYFKLNITLMMNITNVDDKIIKATYLQEYPHLEEKDYPNCLTEDMYLPTSKFEDYADHWERDFFSVMKRMNIRPPGILSRVTEYIPEILDFVEAIYQNGFAFESDGSVYFDGIQFNKETGTHIDEDDSGLHTDKDPNSKYNFVLLKKAKPYEPGWESRWGRIRPGWHIECSAMASSVFGNKVDIHGGGIDLAFPHHLNEVLQSNARFYPPNKPESLENWKNNDLWVGHFMHTGHLNIKGLKMSRSLKNFITIEEALQSNTVDELRMLFLLHQWNAPMDYSDDTMRDAEYLVKFFENFDKQTKSIMLRKNTNTFKKYSKLEIELDNHLVNAKRSIDAALRSNLNTPKVMTILKELVNLTFRYVESVESSANNVINTRLVESVHSLIVELLNMFGLTLFTSNQNQSRESKEEGLIKIVSEIRTDLREVAKDVSKSSRSYKDQPEVKQQILTIANRLYTMTDDIRDLKLKAIGIDLTDK